MNTQKRSFEKKAEKSVTRYTALQDQQSLMERTTGLLKGGRRLWRERSAARAEFRRRLFACEGPAQAPVKTKFF